LYRPLVTTVPADVPPPSRTAALVGDRRVATSSVSTFVEFVSTRSSRSPRVCLPPARAGQVTSCLLRVRQPRLASNAPDSALTWMYSRATRQRLTAAFQLRWTLRSTVTYVADCRIGCFRFKRASARWRRPHEGGNKRGSILARFRGRRRVPVLVAPHVNTSRAGTSQRRFRSSSMRLLQRKL